MQAKIDEGGSHIVYIGHNPQAMDYSELLIMTINITFANPALSVLPHSPAYRKLPCESCQHATQKMDIVLLLGHHFFCPFL